VTARVRRMARRHPRGMRGVGLVELMIGMLLGLLVIGAVIGIYLSNSRVYRTTENVGRVQENMRTAFELLARDLREAAGNPCVNNVPVANVVGGGGWWRGLDNWGNAIRGFAGNAPFPDAGFGTGAGQRLSGTEAIQLYSGDNNVATISAHNTGAATFTLNTSSHGFAVGDLAIACNSRQASLFQVSATTSTTISHGAGGVTSNCTSGLGLPGCSGAVFEYAAPNSVVTRLNASRWFIANNPRGGRSLYQARYQAGGVVTQEIVEGVTGMTTSYLLNGANSYVGAAAVGTAGWPDVIAIRVELDFESEDAVGTDGQPLRREIIQVASLRNRNP
jgi:type IV pilus assembly protein PilW